jgi:O-antigen/teichoic acid export membrane protein
MAETRIEKLTSGKLLARNTIYSLIGQGAPLFVAIFSIPLLIKGLGTDRFGILTIAWIVISYFSLFDLGLGRALTQLVAEKLGGGQEEELPPLIWTASILMFLLGLLGTFLVIAVAPWLVQSALKIPLELQPETLQSFYLLAISIPVVTSTAGFVGILSALQRFDLINLVRIPSGLLMYLGPLLILPASHSLVAIVGVLFITRLSVWGIHIWQCFQCLPALSHLGFSFRLTLLKPLLKFGGWMTVTNLISPLMVYLDRILIGSLISISAVAYYTTPYEVVTKLLLIPASVVVVLFPAFSTIQIIDPIRTIFLFRKSIKYVYSILFPAILVLILFANEILYLWLGKEFAKQSAQVLQFLSLGIIVNSLSQIIFALMQGIGRSDITAVIHVIELPIYLPIIWWTSIRFGISGAAFSWFLRVLLDAIFLYFAIKFTYFKGKKVVNVKDKFSISILSILILLSFIAMPVYSKLIYLALSIAIFMILLWNFILDKDDRKKVYKSFVGVKRYLT